MRAVLAILRAAFLGATAFCAFVVVTALVARVTGYPPLLATIGIFAVLVLPLSLRRRLLKRLEGKRVRRSLFVSGWNLVLVAALCLPFSSTAGRALVERGDWFLGQSQVRIARGLRTTVRGAGKALEQLDAPPPTQQPPAPPRPADDDPNRLEEPPTGAFDRLYARLGGPRLRVAYLGDSHVAGEALPDRLRQLLQRRLGDAGPGFVLVGKPWPSHRHARVRQGRSEGWGSERFWSTPSRPRPRDALLGVAGISVHSLQPASLWFGPKDGQPWSTIDLFLLAQPGGGRLEVLADGRRLRRIATAAPRKRPAFARIALPARTRRVELRTAGGEVRLFGVDAQTGRQGAVVDTLGLNGARAATVLKWDEALLGQHLRRLDPDLLILAYGSNDVPGTRVTAERLATTFDAFLARLQRLAPRSACLVVGPPDQARLKEGRFQVPDRRLVMIERVERRAALEHGCAFWSQRTAMGGPGTIFRWVASDPPLARQDHRHLYARGYRRVAEGLHRALMKGWERYRGRVELVSEGRRVAPSRTSDKSSNELRAEARR